MTPPEILNICIKAINTLAEHGIISSYEKSRFERRAAQEYSRKIQQRKKVENM